MVLKVFSIFDEKGVVFGQPFYMLHNGEALRAFADLVADPQTTVNKHPDDYKLYLLGEFDNFSGKFESLRTPEFIAHGSDYSKK